jgi:hypothetical protein
LLQFHWSQELLSNATLNQGLNLANRKVILGPERRSRWKSYRDHRQLTSTRGNCFSGNRSHPNRPMGVIFAMRVEL